MGNQSITQRVAFPIKRVLPHWLLIEVFVKYILMEKVTLHTLNLVKPCHLPFSYSTVELAAERNMLRHVRASLR
jgi:hypothetical protein